MLSESTRRRIKERKIYKHSNPSQLLIRVKEQSSHAIKDLTLIADNLEEEHLEEIFTSEKIKPLLEAILNKSNKRVFEITGLLAYRAYHKLVDELPNDLVNNLSGDIGKTWIYAQLLMDYSDKPLMKQPKKRKSNSKV